ncbi:hypothetical protein BDF14DRAFT_1474524 [Spinellus fusiger]|nr:hypothetical protein BDF14DRAFT_1474524 [Spinellus fusiger]
MAVNEIQFAMLRYDRHLVTLAYVPSHVSDTQKAQAAIHGHALAQLSEAHGLLLTMSHINELSEVKLRLYLKRHSPLDFMSPSSSISSASLPRTPPLSPHVHATVKSHSLNDLQDFQKRLLSKKPTGNSPTAYLQPSYDPKNKNAIGVTVTKKRRDSPQKPTLATRSLDHGLRTPVPLSYIQPSLPSQVHRRDKKSKGTGETSLPSKKTVRTRTAALAAVSATERKEEPTHQEPAILQDQDSGEEETEKILFSGYLTVLTDECRLWKRRYFVITNKTLSIAADTAKTPFSVLDMSITRCTTDYEERLMPYSFEVSCEDSTLLAYTDNAQTMKDVLIAFGVYA